MVALTLLPVAFLLLQAASAGWAPVSQLILRRLTATLLWNTIRLAAVVTACSALIGTATAWVIERTAIPARRAWGALAVLPVAVPDFVIAWGWASFVPALHGLWGAALVLTLGLYPLVHLPVAASLRAADSTQEDVARSLGAGRIATFRRVTLRQVRPALLGGCLLVALYLLAEYGAFAILRYQTFTTTIFTELEAGFDIPAAAALALVLVALGIVVLGAEAWAARRGSASWGAPARRSGNTRRPLGHARLPVLAGLGALAALAIGVPVAAICYWMASGQRSTLPAASSLALAAWHTASYGATAAALSTVAALPVALLAVRHRGRLALALERLGLLVQAVPGLVVALALGFFALRYARPVYQHAPLLVGAYAVMFFPLALISVRASLARAPLALEDIARALGRRPREVLLRVTVPLVAPGLLAAFFLVFLTAVTELAATLLLVPTGTETLATQFWAYQTNLSYGAAAPYAAVMLGVAAVPTYLVDRWFDRLPSRSGRAQARPAPGTVTATSLAAPSSPGRSA